MTVNEGNVDGFQVSGSTTTSRWVPRFGHSNSPSLFQTFSSRAKPFHVCEHWTLNVEHRPFKFTGSVAIFAIYIHSFVIIPPFHRSTVTQSPSHLWTRSVPPFLCYCSYPATHSSSPCTHSQPREIIQWSCTRMASNSISLLAWAPYISYDDPLWSLSFRSSCCFFFFCVRGIPPPIASTSSHADVFIFITLQP